MAWHLFRLGRLAYRKKWYFLLAWVLIIATAVTSAIAFKGTTSDKFTLPGLESTDAFALIKERTPQAAPDGAVGQIVFQAPAGSTVDSPANKAAIEKTIRIVKSPHVLAVSNPFEADQVSKDRRIAYATVNYDTQGVSLPDQDTTALKDSVKPGEAAGMRVEIGGDALMEIPEEGASGLIGLLVAALILSITFGSLVAAGMPVLTAIIGVVVGNLGIVAASGFVDLGSSTPILASMLGLAVGIDYALFIVSRYRHEVKLGKPRDEAAGIAIGTAGSAVVFAGLTVVIALVGLSVVGISFLTEMGMAAAATVALAVVIALTLLPALFGIAGRWILGLRLPGLKEHFPDESGRVNTFGRRWGEMVTHNKTATIVACLVLAAVLAIPALSLRLAFPDDGSQPKGSGPREAYDLITQGFGAGTNGPLMVVVDVKDAPDKTAAVVAVTKSLKAIDKDVERVVVPGPTPPDPDDPKAVAEYRAQLADGLKQLEKNGYAVVTVVPQSGPSEAATEDLVATIRNTVKPIAAQQGATAYVTGQTALGVDVSHKLAAVFPRYLALVVGLAFVLLTVVFRSLMVPLKAVLGFLVSVAVALGVTVAIFQWGWLAGLLGVDKPGPIMAMLPILLIGILFGLAMDYEVFLVSRMREEYVHGASPLDAVVHGFQHSARVVTAAALIMIGVFVSFAVLGPNAIVKTIGFGLAAGIIADAFLVRMTLVPAVLAVMGERAWALPRWLDRVLPNLDIEGDSLRRHLNGAAEAPSVTATPQPSDA